MDFVSSSTFTGTDLEEWITFSKLKAETVEKMTDLGIECFEDLASVCEDEEFLSALRAELNKVEYSKFKRAVMSTSSINSALLSSMASVTITSSTLRSAPRSAIHASAPAPTPSKTGTSSRTAEEEEEAKLLTTLESITSTTRARRKRNDDLRRKIAEAEEEAKLVETLKSIVTATDQKKTANKTAMKSRAQMRRLRGIEAALAKAASLDLLFMLDCTGSMSGHISKCAEHITGVVDAVRDFYPQVPLRIAFIGYRDHCDGADRLAVLRFSVDIDAFKTFVLSQKAKGGGDGPEDVMGALSVAADLDWQAATRMIFHIADAPCHGTQFHTFGEQSDNYPRGDPNGLRPETLLPVLKQKCVMYKFGRINESTDKMVMEFNRIVGDTNFVDTIAIKDADTMMHSVTASVTDTMYTSLSSSFATTDDGKHKKIDRSLLEFDKSEPRWSSIATETIHKYRMALPASIDALVRTEPTCFVERVPASVRVKVVPLPFDAGGVRVVHKAKEERSVEIVVHKTPHAMTIKDKVRERFESQYVSTHAAATLLAREFMRIKPSSFPGLQYVDLYLIQYLERDGTPYCIQEPMISGRYEKYSNNSGLVVPSPTKHGVNHDVLQAFSHWTHHVTGGFLCVVDCQGVYSESDKMFTLTDPAIHCEEVLRYRPTNLQRYGIRRFFETHKCNDCCRALGLSMPALPSADDA